MRKMERIHGKFEVTDQGQVVEVTWACGEILDSAGWDATPGQVVKVDLVDQEVQSDS